MLETCDTHISRIYRIVHAIRMCARMCARICSCALVYTDVIRCLISDRAELAPAHQNNVIGYDLNMIKVYQLKQEASAYPRHQLVRHTDCVGH